MCSRWLKRALAMGLLLLCCNQPARLASVALLPVQPTRVFHHRKEVKVWVNTASGIYHCPGTRWYGKTKQGKYVSECKAQKAGYHPAYRRPCGSDCAE